MNFPADNVTENYWTLPYVPGRRLAEIPMYILTSAYTFSGAEGFAYRFQVLKRATIVGETTEGGANAGGSQDLAPFFRVYMPMGRPVDSDTRTNWEGVGVVPDIKASARDALHVAHAEAIRALRASAARDEEKARLDWILTGVEAGRARVRLEPGDLERYAGTYGPRRIWAEGGQLRFSGEAIPTFLLTPLTTDLFGADADDSFRIEFVPGAGKAIERVVVTTADGRRWESPRDH